MTKTGLRRAVVVGISSYKEYERNECKELRPLPGADHDAQEIWDRLVDQNIGGFDSRKSHLLKGPEANCTDIRKALSDVFYKTEEPCDIALFYFSGHGRELDFFNEGYLCPYDMIYDSPLVNGIRMSELKQVISRSHGDQQVHCAISILDCCYSGIFTRTSKGDDEKVADKLFEHCQLTTEKGVIGLVSSGKDEESIEITNAHKDLGVFHSHGAFTYHLLEGLGGAAKADRGRISLQDLYTYARDKLEGQQRAEKFEGASTGADRVFIARISEDTRKAIEQKIKDVKGCYACEDSGNVIVYSVPRIAFVLKYDQNNEAAVHWKETIDTDLTKFASPRRWVTSNYDEIEPTHELCRKALFDWFIDAKSTYDAKFDVISTFNQDLLKLLANVYKASQGKISLETFKGIVRDIESNLRDTGMPMVARSL